MYGHTHTHAYVYLYGRGVVREASYDGGDTLVEEGHGGGAPDEVGEGLDQLLAQPRLQGSQGSKLCVCVCVCVCSVCV